MGEEAATITPEASSPSDQSSEELVSTVDIPIAMHTDEPPSDGAKVGDSGDGTPTDGNEAEGAESKPDEEGKPSGQEDRFDKHPRFIELNTRVKTAEEQTQKLLDQNAELMALIKQPTSKEKPSPEDLPYKDTSTMTSEQLLDWQAEDPVGYTDNLRKEMNYRIEQGINAFKEDFESLTNEQTEQQRIVKTFDSYSDQHPDFQKMWDNGEIKGFMDANPGHNAISAHQVLTAEARIKEASDKAVAEALEKAATEQKAKRKSVVLGAGPTSVPSTGSDAELKEPQKHGGATSVLASRLAARRAG